MEQSAFFDKNGLIHYDKYIVYFSGGKDCTACVLLLLESGIPKEKIELWHHNIDGQGEKFMDWVCTPAYCQAFADAFGIDIYFSWKEGGFLREMLRKDSLTAPTSFVTPDGEIVTIGGDRGKENTRMKFPQVSADLKVRWCSAYLKIDVGACGIRNQERFRGLKVCTISGERGEESKARSEYAELEPDRADLRNGKEFQRFVDRWRPVKNWTEQQVWEIIERHKVRVHPCYYLGFSRCSCMFCIFGNADQFASAIFINPEGGEKVMGYEESFGVTIKRKISVRDLNKLGTPYPSITAELTAISMSSTYDLQIIMNDDEKWILPAGAFGEGCGPS
ncbi:phosphoadenosine phosphosulfate reductase domain-containing protein [Pedobacter nyackensis]|uniref:Phosphoadenosine phosphosulfate reductase family protein n=1 Tax=Pedobacter nyackensis TaxID=475255 RepID=A0A1W1ZX15_9SPHI|nr:phosphoadenosine phosphosulfate reductase family protein [Pedobacter nyackensis]SMC52995.1 Phosphoadenosine phosphosulfate reductase family protein [Pedobacter nyackensis]